MKPLAFLLLFSILTACNNLSADKHMDGKVVKIADGDTFTLLDNKNQQMRVRLHGIDAPERSQDFGNVARQKLSDLIFNQPVKIKKMDEDRYGRTVAIVYTKDGACVNEIMLQEGLAWHYKEYDDNLAWAAMEQKAKREKKGLWSQRKAEAPWQWRKEKRNTPTKKAA